MPDFEYSGWLVFYPFRMELKSELEPPQPISSVEETLEDRLPSLEREGQSIDRRERKGFRISDLREQILDERFPSSVEFSDNLDYHSHFDDLIHLEYIEEINERQLVFDPDSSDGIRELEMTSLDQTDLYWIYPEYLFARGSKSDIEGVRSRFRSQLVNSLNPRSVKFDSDFLMWILYKIENSSDIQTDLQPHSAYSAKYQGRESIEISGNDDSQADPSLFIIRALSGKQSISELAIKWETPWGVIDTKISTDRVHILVTNSALSDLSDLQRMSVSLFFLSNFMKLYDAWNSLSPPEKYPSEEDIRDVLRSAGREGLETSISEEVLERYRKLSEEDS